MFFAIFVVNYTCMINYMRHKNMKKLITICLLAVISVLTLSAQSIYDFKVKDDVGHDGRVLKRYEPTDKMTDIEADICMEVN